MSLGFDTYGKDPICDFALTTPVYHECGRRVAALGKRLVILQEGGYHVGDLGENARAWLRGAEGRVDPVVGAVDGGLTPSGQTTTSTTFSARSRAARKAVLRRAGRRSDRGPWRDARPAPAR